MRSKLMTAATVVAGVLLAAQMAAADQVQEQLRLMEQRMAEMEDRLEAQATELDSAQETVSEQQDLLSDAGLVEEDDRGARSGISAFIEAVDITGVAASSFNYRFLGGGDKNLDNFGSARHSNADTFAIDQVWFTIEKAPTEESRGGFHADMVWGETASQVFGGSADSGYLVTGYVSYLAPLGDGMQFDVGRLATPLGAESTKTNDNFNITQGLIWTIQPVTHTGIQAGTSVADGVDVVFGIVNEVYSDTSVDSSRDKAYYGQVAFAGDSFGLNVGGIVGKDSGLLDDRGLTGAGQGTCRGGDNCNTSVVDVVLTADPTDEISLWLNFDWGRNFGSNTHEGDIYGLGAAGRIALTDDTGLASRVEYVRADRSYIAGRAGQAGAGTVDIVSLTTTVDHTLAEGLVVRGELRWDRNESNSALFANGSRPDVTSTRDDQLVGLAEIYYEF